MPISKIIKLTKTMVPCYIQTGHMKITKTSKEQILYFEPSYETYVSALFKIILKATQKNILNTH